MLVDTLWSCWIISSVTTNMELAVSRQRPPGYSRDGAGADGIDPDYHLRLLPASLFSGRNGLIYKELSYRSSTPSLLAAGGSHPDPHTLRQIPERAGS